MNHSILADTLLRSVALAVARNKVGADLPIQDVLAREAIAEDEYKIMAANPQFQKYVDAYTSELSTNGFSIQAKSRVLVEDLLPTMYHLARDPDTPAASRIKMFENFTDLANVKPKNDVQIAGNTGFSVVINFPETASKSAEKVINEPKIIENQPESTSESTLLSSVLDADYDDEYYEAEA